MAKHDPDLDLLFTALGDPTRRAILSRLARGPASVSELAAPHDMALPSFLGHLKKLEDAGLIATAKSGRVRTCTLLPWALRPARNWLDEQKAVWEERLDQFDDYVMQLMKERQHGPGSED
ncbi:metalloregulator ArsR/SmtB family transcription factor [Leisingera sp. ANG59]|uniref:ArsR/SmtB family transcription factor n=1 Tax=Leisingera sp. ANG59 TaxID=2675221 RepID=UPI0015732FB3|nr:metalloregulator ArsR/SmtB family transcription factor [Leisingera sp. ANG59]NSY39194.1 metalloregulator ArsR/SmtB family transcription factor [Leisingera sp. ANG59]